MKGIEAIGLSGQPVHLSTEAIDTLQNSLRGPLLNANSAGYDAARAVWNGMIDKRPALIACCSGAADVVAAVNFAREWQILTAVRGGGHQAAGSSTCDGGLLIDLSAMTAVHVDPSARTARAQGGATWGDFDRETQLFGLATPGGLVSTTGIAGLTLGGGLGFLRRKYGLSCDNLLSVDIVTADGQLRTANATENSDLYWAVRGGGGNFGVVTSFEFQLHPVGPELMVVTVMHPLEQAAQLLPQWRDFMAAAPDEISSQAAFWSIPAIPVFPEGLQGKPIVILTAMHAGSVEEGQRLLQPLRELGTPLVDLSGPHSYLMAQSGNDAFLPKGELRYYMKGQYFDELNDEVIATIVQYAAARRPSPRTMMGIWHMGGAMNRVPVSDTAFGVRETEFMLEITSVWEDPAADQANIQWSRQCWAAMKRFSSGGQYVNFPGLGEEGQLLVREAYAANYDRLLAIKQKYDPGNLFRLNQNIRPVNEPA